MWVPNAKGLKHLNTNGNFFYNLEIWLFKCFKHFTLISQETIIIIIIKIYLLICFLKITSIIYLSDIWNQQSFQYFHWWKIYWRDFFLKIGSNRHPSLLCAVCQGLRSWLNNFSINRHFFQSCFMIHFNDFLVSVTKFWSIKCGEYNIFWLHLHHGHPQLSRLSLMPSVNSFPS